MTAFSSKNPEQNLSRDRRNHGRYNLVLITLIFDNFFSVQMLELLKRAR